MKKKANESGIEIYVEQSTTPKNKGRIFLYGYLLCLVGIFGMLGSFFSAFPVSASWLFVMALVIVALFPITFLFQREKWKNASYLVLLLLWILLVIFLRDQFFIGFIQVINEVIKKINAYTQYNFATFVIERQSFADISRDNTIFLALFSFFITMLLSWLYNVANTRFGCFVLSAGIIALPVAMEIDISYWGLLLLMVFWVGLILLHASEEDSEGNVSPRGQLAILPLVLALLIFLNTLFPASTYVRSDTIEEVREGFMSGQLLPAPLRFGGAGSYTDSPNLAMMGNRIYTGRTVVKVKSENPISSEYLKSYVGNVYKDNRWLQWDEETMGPMEMSSGLGDYKVQNFIAESYESSSAGGEEYAISVENVGVNPRLIFAPYGLSDTPDSVSGIKFVEDGFLEASNNVLGKSKYTLNTYPTFSAQEVIGQGEVVQAMNTYEEKLSAYTEVPDELAEKLDTFRASYGISKGGLSVATAEQVSQVLGELCEYTLAPGVLPTGQDFVSYFLFQSKKGYCVHFASSATLILRSAGIPTRYVEGYVVYPTDYEADGWASLPDSRAHAWIEVYVDQYGWVPVDVTPAISQNNESPNTEETQNTPTENPEGTPPEETELSESTGEEEVFSEVDSNPEDSSSEENLSFTPESEETDEEEKTISPWLKKALWFLLVCILVVGLFYGRRRILVSRREKALTQADPNQRASYIYMYTLRLLRAQKKKEEEYPLELYQEVLKARFSENGIPLSALEAMETYMKEQIETAKTTFSPPKKLFHEYFTVIL